MFTKAGVVKLFPVDNAVPPDGVANQEIVPHEAVAERFTVPVPVLAPGVVLVMVGVALTVIAAVLLISILLLQAPILKLVIVKVVVPLLGNKPVLKLPDPAVVTFIVEV